MNRFTEQTAQMNQQETEIKEAMVKYAKEREEGDLTIEVFLSINNFQNFSFNLSIEQYKYFWDFQEIENNAADYLLRLGSGYVQLLKAAKNGRLTPELIEKLLPEPSHV